ncbi:MAG: kynurenine formamidase [Bdellovibrionaceae bacterium]|nr:kynurenine formamidase [Pseudobdellovibrionaceae bacterium]|tara:strand:- start:162616 stop:163278 length:663 start_codon:yes stop_codon:yes gene_type:complete
MKESIFKSHRLIDISPIVGPQTAVFPGDTPFRRTVALDMDSGDNLTLSSIQTTVHIGAHTDAPNHYSSQGPGIDCVSLEPYFGLCQVIEVSLRPSERIRPEHIVKQKIRAPRVLFKTLSFPDPNQWNNDFNSLSPELIELLAEQGVKLVGIDTPSVDPADDKILESHNCILKKDLRILEGIILTDVSEGLYELMALPLKIEGADASPVRAVLLESQTNVR